MSFHQSKNAPENSEHSVAERLQAIVNRSRAEKASYALKANELGMAKFR